MRRPEIADLMLLATVTLWGLNFTVTKYVISVLSRTTGAAV